MPILTRLIKSKRLNKKRNKDMKIYDFLAQDGDRRKSLYKAVCSHYESLCIKEGNRFMETEKAKEFANTVFNETALKQQFNIT